jgi:hypothetical protein
VYWPLAIPFLAIGFVAVLLLIAFVQIGIFSYALGGSASGRRRPCWCCWRAWPAASSTFPWRGCGGM